ncbi:MAG: MATE family efflux transporter [Phycisphaerales bacterium]|nr:MATE family efflux transporter [Phycisphaerales bacterium]
MPIQQVKSAVRSASEVWSLAWPTVITMMSYTMMQFVDSIMVAQLGPLELSAQGNGGVWTWTVIAALVGVITLVNTFISQSLGAGESSAVARYAWGGIWLALGSWVLVLIPVGFLGLPLAFSLMGHEPRLETLELQYAQILVAGGCFTLVGKAVSNFFFGIGRPKVVTVAALIGNVVNLVMNYVLIFGDQGLPQFGLPGVQGITPMGVAGSAIATVMGVAIECAIPLAIFLGPKMARTFATRSSWRPDVGAIKDLLRVGWPASLQFGNEMFCWSVFMTVLVGAFGTAHLAAGWIVLRYMHLSFMPAVGFSIATTTLVGRSIGAKNPQLAIRYARTAVWMSVVYMAGWGILMMVFREPMVRLFTTEGVAGDASAELVVTIGSQIMICAAVFQAFDAVGIVYTGALRGAGDTLWPGLVIVGFSWSIILGGGWWIMDAHPQLGSLGPWIGSTVYIIAIGGALAWRFERGRWRTHTLARHAAHA